MEIHAFNFHCFEAQQANYVVQIIKFDAKKNLFFLPRMLRLCINH